MKNIEHFRELVKGERELSKNEIVSYLKLYYNFINHLINNKDKRYIDIFKEIIKEKNNIVFNIVNNAACIIDYDYMLQITELELLRKYFSYLVDYNINFISDNNIEIKDEYYLKDSRRFSTKEFIKLLRNALNHNDKSNFQLFRIIQPSNDIDLYIEVYLRKPNFHIQIKVKDLHYIFSDLLKVNSFYEIKFYDELKNKIELSAFSLKKENKILIRIDHLYNFKKEKGKIIGDKLMVINKNDASVFSKLIELTERQKETVIKTKSKLDSFYNKNFDIWTEEIIVDTIPFGMCKLDGYWTDIQLLQQELYNPKGRLRDYIERYNKKDNMNLIDKIKMNYHLINNYGLLTRALSLYSSYIFDTVIPEEQDININEVKENKNKYRNSFVHGRWYYYWDKLDNLSIELWDYEQGDENILKTNAIDIKNITVNKLKEYLNTFINYEKNDFPISLIIDGSGMGYHITRRKDGVTYYCNMSITTSSPIFLVVAEKNNKIFLPTLKEIDKFFDNIENIPKENLDDRMYKFIMKMPEISKKALKTMLENSDENRYRKQLELEIYELYDICLEIKNGISQK